MHRLKRFLPKTVALQIASLVVASLLLAHGITIVVLLSTRSEQAPLRWQAVAVRIATVAQLAAAADTPAQLESVVAAARLAGTTVETMPQSQIAIDPNAAPATRFAARIARLIEANGISVLENATVQGRSDPLVVLKAGDDSAIVFSSLPEPQSMQLLSGWTVLLLSTVTVFTIVLSVYAARWITSPLSSFAAAADSFGRFPSGDRPLAETGPREILQVAQALNEMRSRIRTLIDDRTRMIAAIGHDLRTPLTRLRLRADRVADPVLQQRMIGDITSINAMLTETLSYVRDDLRSGTLSRTDLSSLFQTISTEFVDVGRNVSYEGPKQMIYWCRPGALTRAFTNLIENGVKHGSRVVVVLMQTDTGLRIDVGDDGPGIPTAWRERVFEPFYKIDGSRGGDVSTGFGLGLSIARDIVRSHGGEIELHDHVIGGLVARVLLPSRQIEGEDVEARATLEVVPT